MSRVLKNKNHVITQKYQKNIHNAVDLVAYQNTVDEVIAHSKGKVIWVQTGRKNDLNSVKDETYGNAVKIKHPNGYCTLYAHLKDVYVKLNQEVKQGTVLGMMGNTGRAYGTHLHFEVRKNESYASIIDPTPYLNSDLPNMNNRTANWQQMMNEVYNSNLVVDNSFGPDSKKIANKYQLYYKLPTIKNDHVVWLQKRLNELGYKLTIDGSFGPAMKEAIIKFQKNNNIKANGYVGKETTEYLLK